MAVAHEFIQSVTNLLRNSLQAIRENSDTSGYVKISTSKHDEEIWVHIEDNGEGIVQENRSKLFESQFTTKSQKDGTGLGLSISRRFIRAVGGDIVFVESTPGVKTIFRLTLPAIYEDREDAVA